jgi:hypothetical protein
MSTNPKYKREQGLELGELLGTLDVLFLNLEYVEANSL